MELSHIYGHLNCPNCPNYEDGKKPVIELKNISPDQTFEGYSLQCEIVFLLEGETSYSAGIFNNLKIRKRQGIFLLPGYHFSFDTKYGAQLLILRLSQKIQFCECYLLETLANQNLKKGLGEIRTEQVRPPLLWMREEIDSYVAGLLLIINHGLRCKLYFELKIKELFYLLRTFYTKEELAIFFGDVMSYESSFSYYIWHNYHRYLTVMEMAKGMNIALSSFEKRFKKVFGLSPYRWMNEQRAKKIFNALCTEEMPIKEMCMHFGFASKTAFNSFCKKKLGDAPAEIRKKMRIGGNEAKKYGNESGIITQNGLDL